MGAPQPLQCRAEGGRWTGAGESLPPCPVCQLSRLLLTLLGGNMPPTALGLDCAGPGSFLPVPAPWRLDLCSTLAVSCLGVELWSPVERGISALR